MGTKKTLEQGNRIIEENLKVIKNEKVRERTKEYLEKIKSGERDFRF